VNIESIKEFIATTKKSSHIANSDISWELKHSLIFSNDISEKIHKLGVDFDYYDPDASYQEDTEAFIYAIQLKSDDLKLAVEALC